MQEELTKLRSHGRGRRKAGKAAQLLREGPDGHREHRERPGGPGVAVVHRHAPRRLLQRSADEAVLDYHSNQLDDGVQVS